MTARPVSAIWTAYPIWPRPAPTQRRSVGYRRPGQTAILPPPKVVTCLIPPCHPIFAAAPDCRPGRSPFRPSLCHCPYNWSMGQERRLYPSTPGSASKCCCFCAVFFPASYRRGRRRDLQLYACTDRIVLWQRVKFTLPARLPL